MGVSPANRGIKTGGPYRFIRHPLYTLVIISQIGLLMEYPSIINGLILLTAAVFKGFMIRNEERVLRNDPTYVAYANRVRYRVLPGVV
jgi:protein-S-isoprenylcysteine O-methyltransferase Ste14